MLYRANHLLTNSLSVFSPVRGSALFSVHSMVIILFMGYLSSLLPSCLGIAKPVFASAVICDDTDRYLSRIRPRSRTSFFNCTASAPMTKEIQSSFSTLCKNEQQMNSDLDELVDELDDLDYNNRRC